MNAAPRYYSQWVSGTLIPDFLAGRLEAREDPRWPESGAPSAAEYARWASHICGMACCKMLLEEMRGIEVTLFEALAACRERGGYVVTEEGDIRGLYYRPLAALLNERYGLEAEVVEDVAVAQVSRWLAQGRRFIGSVHPLVRTPEAIPPRRGGHLVYLFGVDERGRLRLHNPSGLPGRSQEDARLAPETFERFFAGRGILVGPADA